MLGGVAFLIRAREGAPGKGFSILGGSLMNLLTCLKNK